MTLKRPPTTLLKSTISPTRPQRADIQGLRAVAVLLVVLFHSGASLFPGGYVGVDVFFVISGFLITGHLVTALRNDGRINFGAFYARRARRILPASFAVLLLSVLAAFIWLPPVLLKSVVQGSIATAVYMPNVLFALQGTNYLSSSAPSVFQHYWSLGVEEQFYLFWPAILALAFLAVRKSQTGVTWVIVGVTAVSFAACLNLTTGDQPWAFFAPWTRAWELGAGGLAAIFVERRSRPIGRVTSRIIAWFGFAGLALAALTFNEATLYPGWAAALPVSSTILIIVGGFHAGPSATTTRLLSTRPMQFVGKISYSLYLVHWPLLVIPLAALGPLHPLPNYLTLLIGAVSIPLAWVLYRFVEWPGQRIRFLVQARPRRSLSAAGIASLIVVALAGGAFLVESRIPLSVDRSVAQSELKSPPIETAFVPRNVSPSLRHAEGDNPAIYGDGCHRGFASTDPRGCIFGSDKTAPLVVLFGDSHAAQWFPALDALAKAGTIRLEVDTKARAPQSTFDDSSMAQNTQHVRLGEGA